MKHTTTELAIFGRTPAFTDPRHVGCPNIGNRERFMERINDVLDRRWLTNDGIYVQEFEKEVAARAGVRHCVAMCNATIALGIAIRALELRGEVILPSFTFVATAHALQWQGITPVFCDVDPRTHTLDPARVEELITPQTTGILGVHLWGRACEVDALEAIARRRCLKLLFDAAHAFGCTHGGRGVGGFGDAEVFSFHATKFLNSFEGGAVVTNDDALAGRIRLMKNFGFVDYDEVIELGTNGKMCEAAAAMGLTSLESMDEFVAVNRRNCEHYSRHLEGIPGVAMMQYDGTLGTSNYQYVIVEVDAGTAGISRDSIVRVLHAENVFARRYFYPGCHRMEPYRSLFPNAGFQLPHTEGLCKRVLVLPTGMAVAAEDIEVICRIIRVVVENAPEVAGRLRLLDAG